MVSVSTQAVIASTYTMDEGYDKNERPSKYTLFALPSSQIMSASLYLTVAYF